MAGHSALNDIPGVTNDVRIIGCQVFILYPQQDRQDYDFEAAIKENIEAAVKERCHKDFNASAIHSGKFSCQTTVRSVTYRAIINGTSDLLTSNETMDCIEDWRVESGTLHYRKFKQRLRLTKVEECPLRIRSFDDHECSAPGDGSAEYLRADSYYMLVAQEDDGERGS